MNEASRAEENEKEKRAEAEEREEESALHQYSKHSKC